MVAIINARPIKLLEVRTVFCLYHPCPSFHKEGTTLGVFFLEFIPLGGLRGAFFLVDVAVVLIPRRSVPLAIHHQRIVAVAITRWIVTHGWRMIENREMYPNVMQMTVMIANCHQRSLGF